MENKIKCPKCKMFIDSLDFDVTATCSGNINIDEVNKGKVSREVYDLDSLMSNVESDNFRCPECQTLLFTEGNEEEQARNFLKGVKD